MMKIMYNLNLCQNKDSPSPWGRGGLGGREVFPKICEFFDGISKLIKNFHGRVAGWLAFVKFKDWFSQSI